MRLLVTCGPTYEPLDAVRRLTNFSTGRLGTELANFLTNRGHEVTCLRGYYSTYRNPCRARSVVSFTTTANLLMHLREASAGKFDAVFHAAAVSDFQFGKVFRRGETGEPRPIESEKFSTRDGALLAELLPTPKIIGKLRALFPRAALVGWKFEVEGRRDAAIASGARQIAENHTDYCVVNGPAYGQGYGVVSKSGKVVDCFSPEALYENLLRLIQR